jgi:hypothetical protein
MRCPFLHKVATEGGGGGGGGGGSGVIDGDWAAPGGDAFIAVHGSGGLLPLAADEKEEQTQRVGKEDSFDQGQQRRQKAAAGGRCPLRGLFSRATSSSFYGTSSNDDDDDDDDDNAAATASNNAWTFRHLLARSVASISFSGLVGPPPGFGGPPGGAPSKGGNDDNNNSKSKSKNAA